MFVAKVKSNSLESTLRKTLKFEPKFLSMDKISI